MASVFEQVKNYIDRRFEEVANALDDVVEMGSLSSTSDDPDGDEEGGVQTGQVASSDFAGDDGVSIFQHFGISGRPPAGSRGIVLRLGDQRIGFLFGPKARPHSLEEGETIVYSTSGGQTIHLQEDGTIRIKQADGEGDIPGASVVVGAAGEVTTTSGGATPANIVAAVDGSVSVTPFAGQTVNLGGEAAALSVAVGEVTDANLQALAVVIQAQVAAMVGPLVPVGVAFAAIATALGQLPTTTSATSKTAP